MLMLYFSLISNTSASTIFTVDDRGSRFLLITWQDQVRSEAKVRSTSGILNADVVLIICDLDHRSRCVTYPNVL